MNYNSFLKKDYKNIPLSHSSKKSGYRQKSSRRLKRIHIAVIASLLAIVSSVLLSVPDKAEATRASAIHANKVQTDSNKIVIDLKLNYDDKTAYIDAPESSYSTLPNIQESVIQIRSEPKEDADDNTNSLITEESPPAVKSVFSDSTWKKQKIKSGESLALIFQKLNLNPRELHDIIKLGKPTQVLRSIQPGQKIKFRIADDGKLQELLYIQDSLHSLHVIKLDSGFQAIPIVKTIEKRITHAKVVIHNSLFEDGLSAGLSNTLIMDLAGIFGWDIDFALDIRSGDQFSIVYQEHYLEGKKIRDGAILAAEFVNQKREFKAIRFTDKHNRTDYYTPDGHSMRKAFLRTPVDFRRISSRFGKRKHPILNNMRLHKGVDYVARRGTPVRASGDGKIVHKRRKGGYGRAIIIKHGGKYSTLYAHLQGYKKGLYVGKKVKQGQTIGYVGSSGRSTGPHLHYEFRVNGVHRNPLTVKLPNAKPINKEFRAEYLSYATKILSQLENYNRISVAFNP
ncbi:MAG: OapA family protein [Gammaproteobacteria bacterium]